MGGILHINEINDDDAAEIAQTQLTGNGLGRFQIGLENCFGEVAFANKTARIHIDRRHGFSAIHHNIASALERHAAIKRPLQFRFHLLSFEKRFLSGVKLQ